MHIVDEDMVDRLLGVDDISFLPLKHLQTQEVSSRQETLASFLRAVDVLAISQLCQER